MLNRSDYPVRPLPHINEGIGGFLCRHFGCNGHRLPWKGQRVLWLLYRKSQGLNEGLVFQLREETVNPQWVTRRLLELDEIPKRLALFRSGRPQICPRCLAQDGFYRNEWDFPLVIACSHHGCLLLIQCVCGRRLSWRALGPDWRCLCGQYLPALPVTNASDECLGLSRLIAQRTRQKIGRLRQLYEEVARLDEVLQRLSALDGRVERTRELRQDALLAALSARKCDLQRMLETAWSRAFPPDTSKTYLYLHAGSREGMLIRWAEKQIHIGHRLFNALARAVFLRPVPIAHYGTIINPTLKEKQYLHRLEIFVGWWLKGSACSQADGTTWLSKTSDALYSSDHRRFSCRLSLLNDWILAALQGVSSEQIFVVLQDQLKLPSLVTGEVENIVGQIDQWLAGLHERQLNQLVAVTEAALKRGSKHD